jgi:pimeloyl-ACP methyl ester carboxylesterase
MEEPRRVRANGIDFAYLESGPAGAPLALLLHGFPDTARSLDRMRTALASAGWRAVAPWMRGYDPTSASPEGIYQPAALAQDAAALVEALSPGRPAALVGHDWGALAACGAGILRPELVRRVVSLALPHPAILAARLIGDVDQLKRSWYMWFFQLPGIPEMVVAGGDFGLVRRLWRDWSPGLDLTSPEISSHLDDVCATLDRPGVLEAALGYYRQMIDPTRQRDELLDAQLSMFGRLTVPALFVSGAEDGCFAPDAALESPSMCDAEVRVEVLDGCGHFLQLERPDDVAGLVVDFLGDPAAPG